MTPAVLLLLPFLFGAFAAFDLLVRREYTAYRDCWVRDGRPLGFAWRPPTVDLPGWWARAGWTLARPRALFGWMLRTPRWASDDPGALRLLWSLRVSALVWNAGVLAAWGA